MQVLCCDCAHAWAPGNVGVMQPLVFFSHFPGTPENTGVMQPLLISYLLLGTPEIARVMSQLCPLGPAQESKGYAAGSIFVPFCGDPGECTGHVTIVPTFGPPRRWGLCSHLWSCFLFWGGPPRMQGLGSNCIQVWPPDKAGVMEPPVILSPFLGTPENARVM